MKLRSMVTGKRSVLLTISVLLVFISGCGADLSEAKISLPSHTIKYQTVGTIHLEVKNQDLTKEQCIAIIEAYRGDVSHQVAVYKYSSLSETTAPWCVINLQYPQNHRIFFNDHHFLSGHK